VSAGVRLINRIERTSANGRDRDGHTQAHAHLRRGRRVHRGRARGAHGAGAQGELRHAAALGASARRRARVGDRGQPARVGRFLVARGERIVRVAPKHMAGARRSSRERGKSDSIDAFSVARAVLKEGIENLPGARLDGAALDIRQLVDHREDLIAARTAEQQRLRWHLHDLWPELEIPAGALDTRKWLGKISRRLARAQQTARVRVARELVREITARTTRIRELQAELTALVESDAPQLLAERGCGPLTAAN
jgi:transposase